MMSENTINAHEFYTNKPRHWDPKSETYTGFDSLLTALQRGWEIVHNVVFEETRFLGGRRRQVVYHFNLHRNQEQHEIMSVVGNPFIYKVIAEHDLRILSYQSPAQMRRDVVRLMQVS